MKSVVLRLEGPMQSWGTQGRYSIRDTDAEPSKSGVLGLVGAALGMKRDDHELLARLRSLRLAVRIDRPGRVVRDLHTVGAGTFRGEPHSMWGLEGKTVVTHRHYLVDAAFTGALGHEDEAFVGRIAEALQSPVWPLFLGRRSCAPSAPVFIGLYDGKPEDAVRAAPAARGAGKSLRLVVEVESGTDGAPRSDDPVSFESADRRFAFRYVAESWMENASADAEATT
jgi:CRISPR system Cascade subunit CasD